MTLVTSKGQKHITKTPKILTHSLAEFTNF